MLTWNLMHGRAVPGAGRELLAEFADVLAGWEWDVALLQEVPPWWPPALGRRCQASGWSVLTSRNSLLVLRRAIARRWPDVIRSNGGGCNTILVRAFEVEQHRVRRLAILPERRWAHAVRLRPGLWVGNVHGGRSLSQASRAADAVLEWGGSAPLVMGGDFNVHDLSLPGWTHVCGHEADHLFVRGLRAGGTCEVLDHRPLSDHAPVVASVQR